MKKILNTSGIDRNDPEVMRCLKADLFIIDVMEHPAKPECANIYSVTVAAGKHYPELVYFIQYGIESENRITAVGRPIKYATDTLFSFY